MVVLSLVLLLFTPFLGAQENRKADIKVDFGNMDDHQIYWANWYQAIPEAVLVKEFPYTFSIQGFNLELSSPCNLNITEKSLYTTCGLSTVPQDAVTGTDINNVLNDGLRVLGHQLQMKFSELPSGHYDLELFFLDVEASEFQELDISLSDDKVTNFKVATGIKPTTSTYFPIIRSLHIPIYVGNSNKAIIQINATEPNFLINGMILTQFSYIEVLDGDVELIGSQRLAEAEIIAYDGEENTLACAAKYQGKQYYFGTYHEPGICEYYVGNQKLMATQFKLIRADPFKEWLDGKDGMLPPRAFAFTKTTDHDYYICSVDYSTAKRLVGVYVPNLAIGCIIHTQDTVYVFPEFKVWSYKNI